MLKRRSISQLHSTHWQVKGIACLLRCNGTWQVVGKVRGQRRRDYRSCRVIPADSGQSQSDPRKGSWQQGHGHLGFMDEAVKLRVVCLYDRQTG